MYKIINIKVILEDQKKAAHRARDEPFENELNTENTSKKMKKKKMRR